MGSDKQSLSHWMWRFPEERLKGLCCRMHTRCVTEHISPAMPCPWSTYRHMQSTCWEKAEEKAMGTQAEGMKCKMYQDTLLMGTVSAPETERTLPPWHCNPVLLSLHFQWEMWLTSSPEEQLKGTSNKHKAQGYFPAVQQDCHIQCTRKLNGSECPDSISHYISTSGYYLDPAASPV